MLRIEDGESASEDDSDSTDWQAMNASLASAAYAPLPEVARQVMREMGLNPDAVQRDLKQQVAAQQQRAKDRLTVHLYHCNHLGTPVALVNEQGTIDWAIELDAWGNTVNEYNPKGIEQPIRMQGQQLDSATGLFYNRHRFYDPLAGRYVNQDPIGLAGGANSYIYTLSPQMEVDPMGLEPYGVVSPERARELILKEGVMPPGRKTWPASPHVYNKETKICDLTEKSCNAEKVHACIRKYPAPGATGQSEVYDGAVSNVKLPGLPTDNHVLHAVDNKGLRVTNMTLGSHLLNPGWVTRDTVTSGGSVYASTNGAGTGFNPLGVNGNDYVVKKVWGDLDSKVKECVSGK